MKLDQNNKLYNLVWMVNGIIKETILQNKPWSICSWKKSILKDTTHKSGILLIQLNK